MWITGLPASGKSTIAKALAERLNELGLTVQILESDELRRILTPKPTYSARERDHFYSTLVFIGELLARNGVNVVFDATAHKRSYRERARKRFRRYLEVHVKCPLEMCRSRDRKGLYKMAEEGKISALPGLQVPYEEPLNPEVTVNTEIQSVRECVDKIMEKIGKELVA